MKINNEIKSFAIEHHGIVMGLIKKIKLIEIIDKLLPKRSRANVNVSNGQVVAAMILSGLGFTQRRLYNVDLFLSKLPMRELFGKDVKAEYFNDDVIGSCLDQIHSFGVTKLFSIISFTIGSKHKLFTKFNHLDTSTISVTGKYLDKPNDKLGHLEKDKIEATITFGHSKDHRRDLKQITYSLVCMGKNKLPIWFEPLDGNKSDKESFHKTISDFEKYQSEFHEAMPSVWVADSAFYTKKHLLGYDHTIKWISRVPENIKIAKLFTKVPEEEEKLKWNSLEDGYRVFSVLYDYGGVIQRWILVSSEKARSREIETFEKRLEKDKIAITKIIERYQKRKNIKKSEVVSVMDDLRKNYKYYRFKYHLKNSYREMKKIGKTTGQPIKKSSGHKVTISFFPDTKLIEENKLTKGRFIRSTYEMDSQARSDKDILTQYKNQTSTVESNFKLLKDKTFLLSEIYLKKTTRIISLLMILTLTLFVYGLGEYWFREEMKKKKLEVTTHDKRTLKNPTLKKIFQLMGGIAIISSNNEGSSERSLTNFTDQHLKIIQLFGNEVLNSYGFP